MLALVPQPAALKVMPQPPHPAHTAAGRVQPARVRGYKCAATSQEVREDEEEAGVGGGGLRCIWSSFQVGWGGGFVHLFVLGGGLCGRSSLLDRLLFGCIGLSVCLAVKTEYRTDNRNS